MTSTTRRLALFGIAWLTFALLLCAPGVAWAQQGSDNGQVPDQDPMTSAVVENTTGDGAGSTGGLDAEAAGVDDGEGAAPASPDAEGGQPAIPTASEPGDDASPAQPAAGPAEGTTPTVTVPVPAKTATAASPSAAPATTTTTAPAAKAPATAKGAVEDGVYFIYSAKSPSRALDVNGASKKSGANVLLWDGHGQANQQWRFTLDKATGNYTIVSVNSNMALAFRSSASGANVYQAKQSSATKGIWYVAKTSSGFALYPAKNKKVALDIEGGNAANGDNVELWTSSGKPWQRFWLVAVEPDLDASKTLADGAYVIAPAAAKGQRVDVAGASQANEANVLLYHSTGGFNQRWYVSRGAGNFYTITSINSGKSLDVAGAGRVPGANVIQYASNGQANQKWQIRDNGDGTYTVVSKHNGLALRSAGTKDDSNACVSVDDGSQAVRFTFAKAKLVGDGVYSISPRQNLSEVADVPNQSKAGGVQVALWKHNKGANQKWQLTCKGGETYTIQAAHSGKYLQDSAGKVVQSAKSGSDSQLWVATWRGTGVVMTNKATGRAITVPSAKDGAPLSTAAVSGKASQRLSFTKRNLVEGGLYIMRSGTGARVLDVNGASKSDGANVQLWTSNDDNNQKFTVTAVSDGYYKIVNLNSNKAVTAAGSGTGVNVRQNAYKGTSSQLWKAEVGPNGGVVFTDKQSGQALSVAGNANANGANVQLAAKSGAKGQTWNMVPTKPHDEVLDRALAQAKAYGSGTNYFIAVDLANHRTVVFRRSSGSWVDAMNVTVSTGAPSSPTVTGTFTIAERGYSFGSGYTCYYWTQFYGDYLFHSVLYDEGTFNVQDGRLGYSISHGCVRMNIDDAYWIYQNVPSGTTVRVY